MLQVLRNVPGQGHIQLPTYFFKDVKWFDKFLQKFNGFVEIHKKYVKCFNVVVDASLITPQGWKKNKAGNGVKIFYFIHFILH